MREHPREFKGRDIVILLAYNRPEFLHVVSEQLSRCSGIDTKEVWLCEDQFNNKANQEEVNQTVEYARSLFKNFKHVPTWPHKHPYWNNVFNALHEAQDTDARFIYHIEDDVFVTKDIFQWSEQAFKQFNPFTTFMSNEFLHQTEEPKSVCLSYSDHSQRAFCIRRENLESILRGDRAYPKHAEEALHNYIIKTKRLAVFPTMSRAFHIGWFGTNVGPSNLTGSLEERIQAVRESLSKPLIPASIKEPQPWAGVLTMTRDRRDLWELSYKAQEKRGW